MSGWTSTARGARTGSRPDEPVDDVTFEVTLANARFEGLPAACLTEGVDPESSITPDGATLLCNLGTVDQGRLFAVRGARPVVIGVYATVLAALARSIRVL